MTSVLITTVRAACETVFKRVQGKNVLSEKLPYAVMPFVNWGHAIAHGEANLCMPLRMPGRQAIVGSDYWENVLHYQTFDRPQRTEFDVGQSNRRQCAKCQGGGTVMHCDKCNRWFHFSDECHDFENCVPPATRNPHV